ncbi:MAG: PEP-CTERM sorting domain-containing protein [Candidatus Hydrogenedentes bacterium]|nr:PEP-CTERM sorting domain-containing protein [Candidatus Hydrogenedentota bacterium]
MVATYTAANPVRTDTGVNALSGSDIYEHSYAISPLSLTAGTTYWINIYNDTTIDTDDVWLWLFSYGPQGGGGALAPSVDSTAYNTADALNTGFAFRLRNNTVVPEPASILLMGLGLGGFAWRARKKNC